MQGILTRVPLWLCTIHIGAERNNMAERRPAIGPARQHQPVASQQHSLEACSQPVELGLPGPETPDY
jgi:hypothetical protein